jgi:hypothetical protein
VVAASAMTAGFIFGHPLRAGHPADPANKILWVVRTPREGAPLQITVRSPRPRPCSTRRCRPTPVRVRSIRRWWMCRRPGVGTSRSVGERALPNSTFGTWRRDPAPDCHGRRATCLGMEPTSPLDPPA